MFDVMYLFCDLELLPKGLRILNLCVKKGVSARVNCTIKDVPETQRQLYCTL